MAHTRKSVRGHGRGVTLLLFCWSTQGFVLPATHAQETDNEAREYARDGSLALEQKAFALAARNFQSALELDPGSAEAHSGLGIALRESGNPSGAISEFQKASRLEPKAWEPRYLLAQTFILLGDFKNAIGELRRSGRAPELAALLMRLHAHQSTNGLYAAHMREILGRDLDLT